MDDKKCTINQMEESYSMSKIDIKDLITSILLRQNNEYTKGSIMNNIMSVINDLDINLTQNIDEKHISLLVDESLNVFCRMGEIRCWNGKYRTADIHGCF